MRVTPLKALLVVLVGSGAVAGCASPPAAGGGPALGEDLFPMEASSAVFAVGSGGERTLRVEPTDTGARLWIEGGDTGALAMDVLREPGRLVFSEGPAVATELLRFGAEPGAEWRSGDSAVRFDGWERLVLPAGTFDAARVRTTTGPASLPIVVTWWFVPGRGLVRWTTDRGGLVSAELTLAR